MPRDAQNQLLTAASEGASGAYSYALEGYLSYRADTGQRVAAMLVADPQFGMAHVFKGYLALTPFDGTFLPPGPGSP
ncbi:MAG: hypothetical protein JWO26_2305 [Rhodospirillales bacterium]|nr:hypothetical protein [Rhodospirillales bacterium]